MSCPCPEGNVNIPLEIQTKPEKRTCLCPGGPGHAYRRAVGKSAEFALATDRFLAPLICRVVRAVRVLGAGLGFPVGAPSVLNPQPPTYNQVMARSRRRLVSFASYRDKPASSLWVTCETLLVSFFVAYRTLPKVSCAWQG